MSSQDNNNNAPSPNEIRWRLKFLAVVLGSLHEIEAILEEDECYGLMCLLNDIADMVCPPEAKS
jgi:hypothetical protein